MTVPIAGCGSQSDNAISARTLTAGPRPSSIDASRNSRANPKVLREPDVPIFTSSCHDVCTPDTPSTTPALALRLPTAWICRHRAIGARVPLRPCRSRSRQVRQVSGGLGPHPTTIGSGSATPVRDSNTPESGRAIDIVEVARTSGRWSAARGYTSLRIELRNSLRSGTRAGRREWLTAWDWHPAHPQGLSL